MPTQGAGAYDVMKDVDESYYDDIDSGSALGGSLVIAIATVAGGLLCVGYLVLRKMRGKSD